MHVCSYFQTGKTHQQKSELNKYNIENYSAHKMVSLFYRLTLRHIKKTMGPLKITITPGVLCKGFAVMSETPTCKEHNSVLFVCFFTGYCSSQNQQDPAHEHAKTPQIKERKESGQKKIQTNTQKDSKHNLSNLSYMFLRE